MFGWQKSLGIPALKDFFLFYCLAGENGKSDRLVT